MSRHPGRARAPATSGTASGSAFPPAGGARSPAPQTAALPSISAVAPARGRARRRVADQRLHLRAALLRHGVEPWAPEPVAAGEFARQLLAVDREIPDHAGAI